MTCKIVELKLPEHPELQHKVVQLLEDIETVDGVAALSEQFLNGITDSRLEHTHLIAVDNDEVHAIAAVHDGEVELGVHSAYRRRGLATSLLATVEAPHLRVWAHGDLPAAQAAAAAWQASKGRELLVMSTTHRTPKVELPMGYTVVNLETAREMWGSEADEGLVAANNQAFDWHPEQGGWDMARWARAQEAEWFSPKDVLLLVPDSEKSAESCEVLGFHWTKWPKTHSDNSVDVKSTTGEVYVVGLATNGRGEGLGAGLISAGAEHLWEKGAEQVILYVESDNVAAVKAYEKLDFSVSEKHVVYSVPKVNKKETIEVSDPKT